MKEKYFDTKEAEEKARKILLSDEHLRDKKDNGVKGEYDLILVMTN